MLFPKINPIIDNTLLSSRSSKMTCNFKITSTFLLFLRLVIALAATAGVFATILSMSNFGKIENEVLFLLCFLITGFLIFHLIKKIIVIDAFITVLDPSKIQIELTYFIIKRNTYIL